MQRELKNSIKISIENEKVRNSFFSKLYQTAENFKKKIQADIDLKFQ